MKKLVFTLSLCFCLFFILEVVSYNFLYGHLRKMSKIMTTQEQGKDYSWYKVTPPNVLNFEIFLPERNDETLPYDNSKKPILTIGCSYTYGQGIELNKTFASQLQKKTNRKVDNVSEIGAGASDCLRSLVYMEKHNILQQNQFEYIIYTQMYEHFQRIYDLGMLASYLADIYKQNKNNSFKDRLKYYLNCSYTVKMINAKRKAEFWDLECKFTYLKYKISKMNEIIKRALPNSKFVVLLYDDVTNTSEDSPIYWGYSIMIKPLDKNNYPELAAQGVKFISTKDLVGDILYKEEYQLKHDEYQYWRPHHPNEKAWEVIVPQLCKKLNL